MAKRIDFNSGKFWLFLFAVGMFILFPALFITLFAIAFILYFVWEQTREKPYNPDSG